MNYTKQTKVAMIGLIVAIFISSCASVNKQRFKAEKFYRTYPQELAALCANKFPPTYKPGKEQELPRDTVYMPGDTVECPPVVNPTTGESSPGKKIPCAPGKTIYVPRLRVDTVESTALLARLEEYRGTNATLTADLKNEKETAAEAVKSASTKQWIIYGLIAAVAFLLYRLIRK